MQLFKLYKMVYFVLFYEYFHGDNGRGVGASHQTGWTGLIAKILQPRFSKKEMAESETEMPEDIGKTTGKE